jgi:hypothetical protein
MNLGQLNQYKRERLERFRAEPNDQIRAVEQIRSWRRK